MELPTYTNIWKIEKRLYKLYDFRLPMPLPVGQIAAFLAIAIPYTLILTMAGMPFSHTWLWIYLLPPGVLAWLVTRPVLEGKRLPELVHSQARYLSEPRTWCRMAPLAEKDEMYVVARAWRSANYVRPATAPAVGGAVAAGAPGALGALAGHGSASGPAASGATVAEPAAAEPAAAGSAAAGPAAAGSAARVAVTDPPALGKPEWPKPAALRPVRQRSASRLPARPLAVPHASRPLLPGQEARAGREELAASRRQHLADQELAERLVESGPATAVPSAPSLRAQSGPAPAPPFPSQPAALAAPAPASKPVWPNAPAAGPAPARPVLPAPGPAASGRAASGPAASGPHPGGPVPPVPVSVPPAAASLRPQPDVGPVGPLNLVERALRSSPDGRNRRDPVVVVPGGHRPGKPDHVQRDQARVRQSLPGPARVVVLGCTAGAGQTTVTLLTGQLLASLRGEAVAVLDLSDGQDSLTEQARFIPKLLPSQRAGADPASRGAGLQVVTAGPGAEDAGQIIDSVVARYPLTLADPGAACVPRSLRVADQVILVAPASEDAANALAMTLEWLDAHDYGRLAAAAIIVLNGVSTQTAQQAGKAAAVASGRCRAIVQIPWDERLRGRSGQPLGSATVLACTALAGVLMTALSGSAARSEVR